MGTIGLIAGSLLAAGGLVLVFTAPKSHANVAFTPVVAPTFQGLMVRSALW